MAFACALPFSIFGGVAVGNVGAAALAASKRELARHFHGLLWLRLDPAAWPVAISCRIEVLCLFSGPRRFAGGV